MTAEEIARLRGLYYFASDIVKPQQHRETVLRLLDDYERLREKAVLICDIFEAHEHPEIEALPIIEELRTLLGVK